jgi:hypothetical protein
VVNGIKERGLREEGEEVGTQGLLFEGCSLGEKWRLGGKTEKGEGTGKGPLAPLVNTYRYQAPPIVNWSYPAVPLGGSFIRGLIQPFRYAAAPIGPSLQTQ